MDESIRIASVGHVEDPLSGLIGRDGFVDRSRVSLGRQLRSASALTMIEIDHFDVLVGRFGQECGSMIIRGVAQQLQTVVRGRDVVGRIDETTFAILHTEIDLSAVKDVGERLRRMVQSLGFFADDGSAIPVTVSIGIDVVTAAGRQNAPDLTGIMARAESRLDTARQAGCNRVVSPSAA
ncbi:MAG: GGDEF domain-containing protein [Alphaproteobacteria bacterium]|nr:GGDEF domain-containing protein [Alphaproteobacteria bacterium]